MTAPFMRDMKIVVALLLVARAGAAAQTESVVVPRDLEGRFGNASSVAIGINQGSSIR